MFWVPQKAPEPVPRAASLANRLSRQKQPVLEPASLGLEQSSLVDQFKDHHFGIKVPPARFCFDNGF